MTYGSNEYWEARRNELLRARRRRELAKLVDAVINAVLAILLIASVVGLCYLAGRETRERASYLEGRWGLDRATAIRYAASEAKARGEGEGKAKARGEGEERTDFAFQAARMEEMKKAKARGEGEGEESNNRIIEYSNNRMNEPSTFNLQPVLAEVAR